MAEEDQNLGYVFTMDGDQNRAANFVSMLQRHQINIHAINKDILPRMGHSISMRVISSICTKPISINKGCFCYRTEFKDRSLRCLRL